MVLWQLQQLADSGAINRAQQDEQVQLVMAGKPPTLAMLGAARSSAGAAEPGRRVWMESASPAGNGGQIDDMLSSDPRLAAMAGFLAQGQDAKEEAALAAAQAAATSAPAQPAPHLGGSEGEAPIPLPPQAFGERPFGDRRYRGPLNPLAGVAATREQQAAATSRAAGGGSGMAGPAVLPIDRILSSGTTRPADLPVEVERTLRALAPLDVRAPRVTIALLSKPPFRFLFDLVEAVRDRTGFGATLYRTSRELAPDQLSDEALRAAWLRKTVNLVGLCSGAPLAIDPNKAVCSLQPIEVNVLLQKLAACAQDATLDYDTAAELVNAGIHPGDAPPPRRTSTAPQATQRTQRTQGSVPTAQQQQQQQQQQQWSVAVPSGSVAAPTGLSAAQQRAHAAALATAQQNGWGMVAPHQRTSYGDEGRQLLAAREAAHFQNVDSTSAPVRSQAAPSASFAQVPPSQLRAPTGGTQAHELAHQAALSTAEQNGWGMVAPDQRAKYGDEGRRLLAQREAAYNASMAQQHQTTSAVEQENANRQAKVRDSALHRLSPRLIPTAPSSPYVLTRPLFSMLVRPLLQYKADLAAYEASERLRKEKYEDEVRKYEADVATWQEQQQAQQHERDLYNQQQAQHQNDREQRELEEVLRLSTLEVGGAAAEPAPVQTETAQEREARQLAAALRESLGAAAVDEEGNNPFSQGQRESTPTQPIVQSSKEGWDDGGKVALAAALSKANRRIRK